MLEKNMITKEISDLSNRKDKLQIIIKKKHFLSTLAIGLKAPISMIWVTTHSFSFELLASEGH